jgi:hypothetical protein
MTVCTSSSLHQHQSSHNLHLHYLAKSLSTPHCQSLITPGSDHPPVLEPHTVLNYPKLHDCGLLEPESLYFMYHSDQRANVEHMKGLYTYYSVLNRLLQASIAPRDGNPSDISRFMKNLMIALILGAPPFSVGDYIWQETSTFQRIQRRYAATACTSCLWLRG